MDKPVIAISIPTGIGADIGGYAGDFGYIAREFAKNFHVVINPNAVNGGILSAINYDKVTFVDQDGNPYYEMYEPIRVPSEDGVEYIYPEGFELVETDVIAEPYRYYRLEDTEVVVRDNSYEESYSISLEKKR